MNNHKEPAVRMVKRDGIPRLQAWGIRLIALVAALAVCSIVIYIIVKLNPLKVFAAMYDGAFGSSRRSWATIRDAMTMLCIGVGLAPAFKMRFWNIGAEGQILVGGIATAACMIYCPNLPTPILFLIMVVGSIIAGAIWSIVPAIFKARWNTNETLFTLMLNYIAIQITSYFVSLWESPKGSNVVGVINQNSKAGWLPNLFSEGFNKDFGVNVLIVLVLAVAMYIYLRYSKHGYEIAVVGESENTARYAGIKLSRVYIRTMALSGAVCGIAGFIAVSGAGHTISTGTAGGRGFTAIIVAWLAKFNTFVMILISFLLVFLEKGAIQIASQYNLNDYVSSMLTGIILFFILGSEFFINYKLVFRSRKGAEVK